MRSGPDGAGIPALTRGWAVAGLAYVMLLAGATAELRGQSPGAAQTATPAGQAATSSSPSGAQPATGAQPAPPPQAQADARPADTKPTDTKPANTKPTQVASTPVQGAAPQTTAAGGDVQSQQVTQQAADLLKLATDLVNEINEVRPETLSVAVVRKADAIEQLAKKMKAQP
jgi:type VI protein secretion system component VasF